MDHNPLDDVRVSDLTRQGAETQVSGREAVSDPDKRDVLNHVDPVLHRLVGTDPISARRLTPAERAEAWNLTYPEGTPVRYWTGAREGAGQKGRTRSAAWVTEGHTAVVFVTGHGAWIALTHVESIPETEG
jgi:hypothetical protein